MLRRLDIRKGESEKLATSLRRSTIIDNTIIKTVQEIIEDVKNKGDRALFDLTLKFDHVELKSTGLRVSRERIEQAYKKVPEQQVSAIKVVKKRLEDYDSILLKSLGVSYSPILGVNVSLAFRPLNSVGCYVPGGKAEIGRASCRERVCSVV
jgi:histidinol dehydrogenase